MKSREFRTRIRGCACVLLALLCPIGASQAEVRTYVTEIPELLAKSPASDWQQIPDSDIVLLELASGTVAVELAPLASPEHVEQWRSLIRAGYYAQSSVQRVHENYVVQWGPSTSARPPGETGRKLADETRFAFTASMAKKFIPLPAVDSYAPNVGFIDTLPVGVDKARERAWVLHCPGVIGTVQEQPDTLPGGIYYYAAIGNPARELDGKISVVGRMIEGIDAMTTLPRGSGVYGFLDETKYVPILHTRLASDMPAGSRPRFERLRTDSKTFAELVRMRGASFSKGAPASAPYPVDACSVPLPVRRATAIPAGD